MTAILEQTEHFSSVCKYDWIALGKKRYSTTYDTYKEEEEKINIYI